MKNALLALVLAGLGTSLTVDVAEAGSKHWSRPSAVTVWWVIFNDPNKCSGDRDAYVKCSSVDVFGEAFLESVQNGAPDPSLIAPNLNAKPAVLYATGGVTDWRGRIRLSASIYATERGTELRLPPGADPMGFGRGLENPRAEIHLVVRDHGKANRRDLLPQITNFLDPYCSDPNLLYFSGPNLCADTHFAVFGPRESGSKDVLAFANPSKPVRGARAYLLREGDVIRAVVETRIRNRRR